MDDIAVPQHHRVGAHRARRHPALAVAVPVAAVAGIAVVFVWALTAFLGGGGGEEGSLDLATASAPPVEESPGASAAEASPSEPAGGGLDPLPTSEASPEASPEASADQSVPVNVLNSTATVGLAAGAAESLEGSGWEIAEVGNYAEGEIPTTVFYAGPELATTAAAVAADLGAGTAEESADFAAGTVTVVLGGDYSGG